MFVVVSRNDHVILLHVCISSIHFQHYAFQTEEKLHLVMDLLPGGSLFDRLSTSPEPFSEEGARCYAAECLLAIEAMHECDIVYR